MFAALRLGDADMTSRLRASVLSLALLACLLAAVPVARSAAPTGDRTYMVTFENPTDMRNAEKPVRAWASKFKRGYGGNRLIITLPAAREAGFKGVVAGLDGVKSARPVAIRRKADVSALSLTPSDPNYADQWGLPKVGALGVWNITRGAGVTVAVIDTGADLQHPDLAGRLDTVNDRDFVNDDMDADDDEDHGTHVAGIIAANLDNAQYGAGLAPEVTILPVKVLDSSGYGTDADVINGIYWAVDHGADVISISLGGTTTSAEEQTAIDYAHANDVVVCAAAGNDGANIVFYPANLAGVLGVGASTSADGVAWFSNYGAGMVDIAAPGAAIWSIMRLESGYPTNVWDGTSMATPFVSAAAALVRAQNPGMTHTQVEQRLMDSADDIGAAGYDSKAGWGRLNAHRAVAWDDILPGMLADPSPIDGEVNDTSDMDDVFKISLANGQTLDATMTPVVALPAAGRSFATMPSASLYAYGPWSTSLADTPLAVSQVGGTEHVSFTATSTAFHSIDVRAGSGLTTYQITYTITQTGKRVSSLSLASSTNHPYVGGTFSLFAAAKRTDDQSAIQGVTVRFERQDGASWVAAGSATTNVNGVAELPVIASGSATYRAVFDGTATDAAATSATTTIIPRTKSSLTMVASTSTPAYGTAANLTATLKDPTAGTPFVGRTITLYRWESEGWISIGSADTNSSGQAVFSVKHTYGRKYLAAFSGEGFIDSAASAEILIKPKVYLSVPTAPLYAKAYVKFRSYGVLKPRHAVGTSAVKLQFFRYESGRWVLRKTVFAKSSNVLTYSRYTGYTALYRGVWRIRPYAPADSAHSATYGSYSRMFRVY